MTSGNGENKTYTACLGLHMNKVCGNKWLNLHWTSMGFQPMHHDDEDNNIASKTTSSVS